MAAQGDGEGRSNTRCNIRQEFATIDHDVDYSLWPVVQLNEAL